MPKKLLDVQGFRQIGFDRHADAADGRLRRRVAGDEDDGQAAVQVPGLLDDPQIRIVRHADIGDQYVVADVPKALDRLFGVCDALAVETLAPQQAGSRFPERFFIVGDQDRTGSHFNTPCSALTADRRGNKFLRRSCSRQ